MLRSTSWIIYPEIWFPAHLAIRRVYFLLLICSDHPCRDGEGCFRGHMLQRLRTKWLCFRRPFTRRILCSCFYRGITMQRAVKRDSENRSNYAMCADSIDINLHTTAKKKKKSGLLSRKSSTVYPLNVRVVNWYFNLAIHCLYCTLNTTLWSQSYLLLLRPTRDD